MLLAAASASGALIIHIVRASALLRVLAAAATLLGRVPILIVLHAAACSL
jgi:hypothetical protein